MTCQGMARPDGSKVFLLFTPTLVVWEGLTVVCLLLERLIAFWGHTEADKVSDILTNGPKAPCKLRSCYLKAIVVIFENLDFFE